jgi:tripeptidyl-peptidase-1
MHIQGNAWTGRGYFPAFPASCPYVTAVGATMGPESGDAEKACQSQEGGVITTGGGFSTFYATPDWQQAAVDGYFNGLSPDERPTSGYNRNGRGYPDISFIGTNYQVVLDGHTRNTYGTSASAPVFAAMLSVINAARIAANKTTVGFINPTLYAYGLPNTLGTDGTNFNPYTDVVSGHNKCTASGDPSNAVCCAAGFHTEPGWDPVTGWGSARFPNLAQMFDAEVEYTINDPQSNSKAGKAMKVGALSLAILIVIIIVAAIVLCSLLSCVISMLWSPCKPKPPPTRQPGLQL